MKRFFPVLAVLLLLGAFGLWRVLNPPRTDAQQIAANLDALVEAANRRSSRGVTRFLARNFDFNGTKKRDFAPQLAGALLQYRVVDLQLSGVQTQVSSDKASSSGRFDLSLKSEFTSPPETSQGQFQLRWRKIEGEWKITEANGTAPGLMPR